MRIARVRAKCLALCKCLAHFAIQVDLADRCPGGGLAIWCRVVQVKDYDAHEMEKRGFKERIWL